MKKAEFDALKPCDKHYGAIGYAPHDQQIVFYRAIFGDTVYVCGIGHYHYRSIQLQPHVSAVLLKESNNKK